MLPRTLCLLSTRTSGEIVVPNYLTERDHAWLRFLLDEHARFVGERRTALRSRLSEPLPIVCSKTKLRVAVRTLDLLTRDRVRAPVVPRKARAALFGTAAARDEPRAMLLEAAAQELGASAADVESSLFADLPGERRITALPPDLSPGRLALEANRILVASFLRRAARLRVRAWGNTRALVRQAHLAGLICTMERAPADAMPRSEATIAPEDCVAMEVSGPFALFRHTDVYGRALATLVPRATWCESFEILADCALGVGSALSSVMIRAGDPIACGRELERFDSRVEKQFARDFLRAAPDWDLIREPHPIELDRSLIFPDFELVHRRDPNRRWLLEIVGFWTADYVERKLRQLRAAGSPRLILCLSASRNCHEHELPERAWVIRYKRRIDVKRVLEVIAA